MKLQNLTKVSNEIGFTELIFHRTAIFNANFSCKANRLDREVIWRECKIFSGDWRGLRNFLCNYRVFYSGKIRHVEIVNSVNFHGSFNRLKREKMLEIMKDSRVGAFGLVGFVMISILNFALLNELAQSSNWLFLTAIYTAPIIGRLMMVITIGAFPYARPEGMGKAFSEYTTKTTILFALCETLILLLPLLWLSMDFLKLILGALIASMAFTFYFGNFAVKKIGGVTGDIYGATTTFSESIVFLSFLIF